MVGIEGIVVGIVGIGIDGIGGRVTFGIVGIVVGNGRDGMGGKVAGMVGSAGLGNIGKDGIMGRGGNVGRGRVGTTGKAGDAGVSKRWRDAIARFILEKDTVINNSRNN
ncbi:hypothetical protein ACHQM5_008815 [Ranunculus cassubicifolius]